MTAATIALAWIAGPVLILAAYHASPNRAPLKSPVATVALALALGPLLVIRVLLAAGRRAWDKRQQR